MIFRFIVLLIKTKEEEAKLVGIFVLFIETENYCRLRVAGSGCFMSGNVRLLMDAKWLQPKVDLNLKLIAFRWKLRRRDAFKNLVVAPLFA